MTITLDIRATSTLGGERDCSVDVSDLRAEDGEMHFAAELVDAVKRFVKDRQAKGGKEGAE